MKRRVLVSREVAMNAGRFDGLARTLARISTRRSALRLAGGALAAVGIAEAGVADAKRHRKKKCKNGETRCQGTCCAQSEACVGGVCKDEQANCPNGADSCSASGEVACTADINCSCYQRLEGGTRCVQFLLPIGACDQCKTDADCRRLGFPPGSSCIEDHGPTCTTCHKNKRGYCGEPCGFEPSPGAVARQTRSAGPKG